MSPVSRRNPNINFYDNNIIMDNLKSSVQILEQNKQTRSDLSKVYRSIKEQLPNVKWLDVLRKSTRNNVKDKIENKFFKTRNKDVKKAERKLKEDDKEVEEMNDSCLAAPSINLTRSPKQALYKFGLKCRGPSTKSSGTTE